MILGFPLYELQGIELSLDCSFAIGFVNLNGSSAMSDYQTIIRLLKIFP